MPNPGGDKGLINKERLLEIVKNYEIENLTIKEDDKNGVSHVSFTSLPPSRQQGMDAMAEEAAKAMGQPTSPNVVPMPSGNEPPPPRAASQKVKVRIAMSRQDIKRLRRRYPDKFLRSMGL